MIYPEDTWKTYWDLFVALVLIFTCCVTPFRLAFSADANESLEWYIANYTIDFVFFLDIVFIFNTAYYHNDFRMEQHRGMIAWNYFKGWFIIDLLAIIPTGEL